VQHSGHLPIANTGVIESMSGKVLEQEIVERSQGHSSAKVSRALRNTSREARNDILRSYGYHALWLGQITHEQYIGHLHANWAIRLALEATFDSLQGEFRVRNLANNEEKVFAVQKYVTPARCKAHLLADDLRELTGSLPKRPLPPKAQELIDYIAKVNAVYSAGLLGILYVLEESVTGAGRLIAGNLDRELKLNGGSTRFLRAGGEHKRDLWKLRRSLDLITDFQTQVNIVTAASIAYGMYRDMIDPYAGLVATRSVLLN